MSNNSCDGSVWNVLTGKFELRPKEAFTSKRLGFASSCGGFSHTWWAVETCHPSDNESKWGVPISAGANQQHLDKQLNSPQTSDGTGGKGRFTAKMLIGRCFQIGPLFLKLPGNANRHEARQCDLCYGQYLHNTCLYVWVYSKHS